MSREVSLAPSNSQCIEWSKCRKQVIVEFSATNRTFISHPTSGHRYHHWGEIRQNIRTKGREDLNKTVSLGHHKKVLGAYIKLLQDQAINLILNEK